jgi:hypothetical protein
MNRRLDGWFSCVIVPLSPRDKGILINFTWNLFIQGKSFFFKSLTFQTTFPPKYLKARISWGIYGLPKVSLGLVMIYHYALRLATPETVALG